MKKVTGIGGIFLKCKDPKKMKEWHKTYLGLNTTDYEQRLSAVKKMTQLKRVMPHGARLQKQQNLLNLQQKTL